MKFRGKMTDIICIDHFTRIVNTISRITKNCILRLTIDKLDFVMKDRMLNGGIAVWCDLNQNRFFNEYNMEGVSEEYNEIYLEILLENVVKVMKSAHNAKSVKIKLTNKSTPCLTFEIELPSLTTHSRLVIHDIAVAVIPRRQWGDFVEPEMPNFHISIYMPSLKTLRNIVERMKNISAYMIITANQQGDLRLKVVTDTVTATTNFQKLEIPSWNNNMKTNNENRQRNEAEARIDIKRFSHFLSGHQMNPTRVICNITHNRMIHLFLLHDDVTLQYFIPAIEV